MGGFSGFDPVISRLGGIASRRELRDAGWDETDLWFAWSYGNLDRIRHGWYASADLPDDARAAWKAGGPLACVSALRHHGMLDDSGLPTDLPFHICVATDAHLPPVSKVHGSPADVIVHWSTTDRYSGSRQAVAPRVALRQARACSSPAARAAAARAAELSRSRIQRGTAVAAKPSARNPATRDSSSTPTSQASSRPPSAREP